jgi:hypothetical protein
MWEANGSDRARRSCSASAGAGSLECDWRTLGTNGLDAGEQVLNRLGLSHSRCSFDLPLLSVLAEPLAVTLVTAYDCWRVEGKPVYFIEGPGLWLRYAVRY